MKRNEAYTKNDTFWNKVRVKAGYTTYDVASLLNVSRASANNYLIGKNVPSERQIETLCDFFGVDRVQGEREFYEAHRHYDADSHRKRVDLKQTEHVEEQLKAAQEYNERVAAKNKPAPVEEPALVEVEETDIFKLVYDVLSYQEFNEFFTAVASKSERALELIFHKVDYDTYKKISKVIQEG